MLWEVFWSSKTQYKNLIKGLLEKVEKKTSECLALVNWINYVRLHYQLLVTTSNTILFKFRKTRLLKYLFVVINMTKSEILINWIFFNKTNLLICISSLQKVSKKHLFIYKKKERKLGLYSPVHLLLQLPTIDWK